MGYRVVRSRVTPAGQAFSVGRLFSNFLRMILPLCIMALILLAAYETSTYPFTGLDGFLPQDPPVNGWISQGALVLTVSFLVINLLNRAKGPGFTAAFIVVGWLVIGGAVAVFLRQMAPADLPAGPLPEPRALLAFCAALFAGHMVTVATFHLTRGVHWWTGPFWGTLTGGVVFTLIFQIGTHAGITPHWPARLTAHLVVHAAAAMVLLIPYFIARPIVKPQPGFGGA